MHFFSEFLHMLNYGGGNMTSFFRVFKCGMWYENTGMPEYIQILQKYYFFKIQIMLNS